MFEKQSTNFAVLCGKRELWCWAVSFFGHVRFHSFGEVQIHQLILKPLPILFDHFTNCA